MPIKRGSALLIALFVMATLGLLGLVSSRIYVSEANTSSNLSAGTAAYYIAEGALEKSLLDYRVNRDVQLSVKDGNKICDPTQNCQALVSDQMADVTSTLNLISPSEDAKAYSRVSFMGDKHKCKDAASDCDLHQDETIQIVIPSSVSNIILKWSEYLEDFNSSATNLLRVSFSYYNNSRDLASYSHDDGEVYKLSPSDRQFNISIPSNLTQYKYIIIRLRPLNNGLDNYWLTFPAGSVVDTGQTTIDALGQVAGVSRQLQVVIDRQKSGLNQLFDYTIFAKEGSITTD